jgi:hypothetical protein
MQKVSFFDRRVFKEFLGVTSVISTVLSLVLIFFTIPAQVKLWLAGVFFLSLAGIYIFLWHRSNTLQEVELEIEGSTVTVKSGDLFEQPGFKAIAFNEFFDTEVDEKIISSQSLNGIFVKKYFPESTFSLNEYIENYHFEDSEILEKDVERRSGKKTRYSVGSVCVYNDYLLAAFSKFDENNRARLTMPEYLGFLITFWDRVNRVYAQNNVSVPIFGSGITRIKEHRGISDEDLLKIMLWTFRISEMRFKYPAKLTIVIHKDKIKKINLLDVKSARNGL